MPKPEPVWTAFEASTEPGALWIGIRTGLDRLDRATGRFTHIQPENPWAEGPNVVFAKSRRWMQAAW